MKTFFCFLTVLLTVHSHLTIAQVSRAMINGTWYTNGQTVYVGCSTSNVNVQIDQFYNDDGSYRSIILVTSSNFTYSSVNAQTDQLHLDSSHQDGTIQVGAEEEPNNITLVITQKPPVPTFTSSPALCSSGSSATYSVSDSYGFQSTSAMNLVWQTTGGITVNGGSTYTTSSSTTSSVTIQASSFGTVSVHGVIPGCGNIAGNSVSIYVGTPGSSDITFNVTGGGDNGSSFCVGNTRNYQSNPNLPLSQYTYSWSIPTGSSNVSYFYSYGPNATVTAGSTGGFVLQMNVSQNLCSTVGGTSRTFFISNCGGGYYRVANNPTSDKVTALFDASDDAQSLPTVLRFSSEKTGVVKEIKVKGQYSDQAVKDGLKVDIDVHALPRGTYYLQGIYDSDKTESVRVILQ